MLRDSPDYPALDIKKENRTKIFDTSSYDLGMITPSLHKVGIFLIYFIKMKGIAELFAVFSQPFRQMFVRLCAPTYDCEHNVDLSRKDCGLGKL